MRSEIVQRLLELGRIIHQTPPDVGDWGAYALTSDGKVLAGRNTADGDGIDVTAEFEPVGVWAEVAKILKAGDDWKEVFMKATGAEFAEFKRLQKLEDHKTK